MNGKGISLGKPQRESCLAGKTLKVCNMNGKGISLGKPQRESCLAGKTLKVCNRKKGKDYVVLIDLDSDNYNNVIFVDVPEFLQRSSSNGDNKGNDYSLETVICIDEEEDYDEYVENKGKSVQDNAPVTLSKCKRTYSSKASTSNRYGLYTDMESISSDDEEEDGGPDFEFESFSGKLKQDWEKAFLRRQNEVLNRVDQTGTFGFCSDSHQEFRTGEKTERYHDKSDFSSHTSSGESDRSPSVAMDIGKSENAFSDNGCETSTFNRETSVCNDQFVVSDHAGTSYSKEDGSLEEEINVKSQPFGDISNEYAFFNREMHKETDEYRRSVEAELAARQRELQIQAEEAQHLKRLQKRKRAENMRLLDMERRQKVRVEEMRKTQKKDAENLNLKEQLRAEVQKDLDRLETTCRDMPSILQGLGININGVNGVHAAFKRALFTFHPDRASRSDIREQVEAEEKFKLITRIKEKFMSTLR